VEGALLINVAISLRVHESLSTNSNKIFLETGFLIWLIILVISDDI
jgi:hypothetical protein